MSTRAFGVDTESPTGALGLSEGLGFAVERSRIEHSKGSCHERAVREGTGVRCGEGGIRTLEGVDHPLLA